MAQQSFYFRKPRGRNSYPIGPFNGGVDTHISSTRIKDHQLLDVGNYICQPDGLKRRPSLARYSNQIIDYPPIQGILTFWKLDGTQETIILDEKFVYLVDQSGIAGKYLTYSDGTVTVAEGSLSTVTGDGTLWLENDIKIGDVIVIGTEERIILSVDSETSLSVSESFSEAHAAGTSYECRKAFSSPAPAYLDWTVGNNRTILAPGNRPLLSYDGTLELQSDSDNLSGCVSYFKDRIWAGRIQEGANDYRSRIRWTKINDHEDWALDQYVDIPYTSGYVMRLVPFGDLLVAYFDTAIYLGYPTNYPGDTLPLAFRPVETGGIGLLAPRGVVAFVDAHFFVGTDDIYYWPASGKPERIGDPVIKRTVRDTENYIGIQTAVDTRHKCIYFGFPKDGSIVEEIWMLNYSSGAWSKCDISCSAFSLNAITNTMDWSFEGVDVSDGWGDLDVFPSWEAISNSVGGQRIYFGKGNRIYFYQDEGTIDAEGVIIPAYFITKDFTFGVPDTKKTISRFSLKIDIPRETDLVFRCWYSTDRGRTWSRLPDLTIPEGDDESSIGFLATGSTIRFKLESFSEVSTYTIEEIGLLVKGRGLELHYGPAD